MTKGEQRCPQPLPSTAIDGVMEAIDLRNEIVHEGKRSEDPGGLRFRALATAVKAFPGLEELKTPELNSEIS